jgi:hypothetical protein
MPQLNDRNQSEVTEARSQRLRRDINFITEMNGFYTYTKTHHLSSNAQLLWMHLFCLWNEAGFPEWLQVDAMRMMTMIDTKSRSTMVRARDQLINAGLLICQTQNNNQPNKYRFVSFGSDDRSSAKKKLQTGHETGHGSGRETDHGSGHETGHLYKLNKNKPNQSKQKDLSIIKKSAYGEFGNVFLSDEELSRLKDDYPGEWEEWIKRLSLGKEMKGYDYHNDYAAILSWIRKQEDEERDKAYQELLDELY